MRKVEKLRKPCKECGKLLLLHPSAYERRSFCSLKCKGLWQEKNMVGYWKGKKMPFYKRPNRNMKGINNTRWKGGRRIDKDGYILIWQPDHPSSDYHGYVREHRLIMEEWVGRHLEPKEIVHHKDGNKQNNKIENLELYKDGSEHQKYHYRSGTSMHLRNYKT